MKKIKILTISDNPLSVSGVAHQARNVIEAALDSGFFEVTSIAWEPRAKQPQFLSHEQYGGDWKLHFTSNTEDKFLLRALIHSERPDIVWIMTDPRRFYWLFEIETEIRYNCPVIYYHVWDNHPTPKYNLKFYNCCDKIVSISKLTHDIIREICPEKDGGLIPHSVDHTYFFQDNVLRNNARSQYGIKSGDVVFGWINRNGYRKMAQTVMESFASVSKQKSNVKLLLKTDPLDPYGPNLYELADFLHLDPSKIMFLPGDFNIYQINSIYNAIDYTLHVAHNEGFGLTCLESMNTGTPVIANLTGGLKDQVDSKVGIPLEPDFSVLKGSQDTPYIYEDYIGPKSLAKAMLKAYNFKENRVKKLSEQCKFRALNEFNFEKFRESWVETLLGFYHDFGSWENRKNYKSYMMEEM